MIFRIYHETRGGHVHMRIFGGTHDGALGKCGDLCMRVNEFAAFREMHPNMEFRAEPMKNVDRLNLVRKLSGLS